MQRSMGMTFMFYLRKIPVCINEDIRYKPKRKIRLQAVLEI